MQKQQEEKNDTVQTNTLLKLQNGIGKAIIT